MRHHVLDRFALVALAAALVLAAALCTSAVAPATAAPPLDSLWEQLGETLDGGAAADGSGWAVDMSSDGGTVIIGAPFDGAGRARVFAYDATAGWAQVGGDIDGEAADDEFGFSVAMSADGRRVVVGAPYNNGTGSVAGHARVYAYDATAGWTQVGDDIDGEAPQDFSGWSVDMSADGSTVIIGAPGNSGPGIQAAMGHARVHTYAPSTGWTQVGDDIDGESASDMSGWAVAMSADGNTVAIGAPSNDDAGSAAGHARVYAYEAAAGWILAGADIDGEAAGDQSGTSVALSADGDSVIIGGPGNAGSDGGSGHARVHTLDAIDGWVQVGDDIEGDAVGEQGFGRSVNISGDGATVVIAPAGSGVGTPFESGFGLARVYSYEATGWAQVGDVIRGDEGGTGFGRSVGISSDGARVAVGRPSRVFEAVAPPSTPPPGPLPTDPTASPTPTPTPSETLPPAEEPPVEPDVVRLGGPDRIATAVLLSAATFPAGVDTVLIAAGATFPDALTGAAAAATGPGPVLLVPTDTLPDIVDAEIRRLAPRRIVLLGGTAAISEGVEDQLATLATVVDRRAGPERYATAAAISAGFFTSDVTAVWVASGETFADALPAGPGAGLAGSPLLLTARDTLPPVIEQELQRLAPDRIVLLGGTAVVSTAVEDLLASIAPVTRLAGPDRYATAAAVAQHAFPTAPAVLIASGQDFADALAAGPVALVDGGPVLLVTPDQIPAPTDAELRRLVPQLITIAGGTAAVSDSVQTLLAEYGTG